MLLQARKTTQSAKDIQDALAAEWESFEKLIQAGGDEQPTPAATERNETGQPVASTLEVRRKRVFREVQSDSDGDSNSDSEDGSHPALPGVGMNTGSSNKVDRRSSSSDSSRSSENKVQTKPAVSDSDSSSDDEEQAAQRTKLPSGKCDMVVACEDAWVMF